MAKYFIALILLASVALESTNISNRFFAKSQAFKPTHHHLRPSDHKTHRDQHHRQHPYPHHHLPQHNSHQQQLNSKTEHDQYMANQGHPRQFDDEFPSSSKNTEEANDRQSEEESIEVAEEPKNKPNLWFIVNKELNSNKEESVKTNNEIDYFDAHLTQDPDMPPSFDSLDSEQGRQQREFTNNELDSQSQSQPQMQRLNSRRRSHNHQQEEHQQQPKAAATIKCPKCESNRQNVRVSEEELTRLRIEFVKRQILEKLRLKDKPNVSASGMPKPIYEETTIHQDEPTKSKDLDDYYARASKKFIFLEREKQECNHLSQPSICFSFKIDDLDLESIDVSKAVLWIYKKRNAKDLLKQTIVVSEVEQGGHTSKYLPKVKPIAIQSVDVHEDWMKIDIEWPIKRWFGIHELSHLIHISCQSCEVKNADSLISTEKDYRPFIMIDTQNRRRVSRQKRSVNCTNGVTECCREKLYISFDEIGWGDWIISPRGYDAYFCRGSCSTAASIAQSTTHHSSLMRKVISHRDTAGKKPLELIPCCTANQYSSLEIFFRDSNNTATLMKFPNMVIESCGCM